MPTGLKHIQQDQVHESVFNQTCHSFSWSVLTIEFCIDLSIPQVTVNVYLAGIKIGGGTLNPQHPSITVGGSAMGFKAEVTLSLDVSGQKLEYKAEVCAPIAGCKDKSGTLFSW